MNRLEVRLSFLYFVFSILWIVLSDTLLLAVLTSAAVHSVYFGMLKGMGFVCVTTMLLYWLMRHELARREAVETALSQQSLLATFEQSAVGIAHVTPEGYLRHVNPTFARTLGYTRQELRGMHFSELTHPDDIAPDMEAFQQLAEGETDSIKRIKRYIRKDGQYVWATLTASSVFDQNGGLDYAIAVIKDISEMKWLEDELRQERDRIQTYLDLVAVILLVIDTDGCIQRINQRGCQILGYSEAELLGREWFDFIPERDRSDLRQKFDQLVTGDVEVAEYFENPIITRSGEERLIAWRNTVMYDIDGRVAAVIDSGEDITERRRTEDALKRSEEQMRMVIQSMPVIMNAFDENQLFIVWNKEGERLTGYTADEIIANPKALELLIPDRDYRCEMLARMKEMGNHFRDLEWHVTCKDGSQKTIYWSNISNEFPVPGWASWSIGIDVTRQLQAEHELQDANHTLEMRVEQRTSELRQARLAERHQRLLAEALRKSATALNRSLDLDVVLDYILSSVQTVIFSDMVTVMLLDAGEVRIVRAQGGQQVRLPEQADNVSLGVQDVDYLQRMAEEQRPLLVNRLHDYPDWPYNDKPQWVRAYMGAPIITEDMVIGFINILSLKHNAFEQSDLDILSVFCDQAAVAIRNARLYQQAGELAALEERQRIARDLHDAVTQTLFSANVVSKTLLRLHGRDPDQIGSGLQQLNQLTRGALAEMRTLLLELRPETLAETPIDRLLQQLGDAFSGRTETEIVVEAELTDDLYLPVKIVFYRVAQEALNNVYKHARARHVQVRLWHEDVMTYLSVMDDGRGFDPAAIVGDHLGLKIMRERAESIGARLGIRSQMGTGTTIEVEWSA